MFKFFIDTCVWFDLAKNRDEHSVVNVIEDLIKMRKLSLIVPRSILDEFEKNKSRIAKESNQNLKPMFNKVKDVIRRYGDEESKRIVLEQISNVDFKLPFFGEQSVEALAKIESILKNSEIVEISDSIKLAAAQRAIEKKAPFHRQRNSMNDAIIFETYVNYIAKNDGPKIRFAFITHNKHDFSDPAGNENHPHPDISLYFQSPKFKYYINLAQALYKINPSLISDLMIEHEDWLFEQRSYSDIIKAELELETKIWYNRHQIRGEKIESGDIKIIDRTQLKKSNPQTTILDDIWEGAKESAKKVEDQYGKENLLWDDFEWGMLNGKLSALRWVMGEEWDSLYT